MYLELFLRNLLLDENNELHNRTMHISGTFDQKLDIESAKLDIRNKLLAFSNTVSEKTINHAINLIKLMKDSNLITPVTGQGKGKYRFG